MNDHFSPDWEADSESHHFVETPPETREGKLPRPSTERAAHIAAIVLAVLATLYTFYFARAILFPIFLAVVIAFLLRPLIRLMQQIHIPAVVGAGVLVAGFFVIIAMGVASLIGPASQWIEDAPAMLSDLKSDVNSLRQPFEKINEAGAELEELANGDKNPAALEVQIEEPQRSADTVLTMTTSFLIGTVIFICQLFFLLAYSDQVLDGAVGMLPDTRDKQRVRVLFAEVEAAVSKYLATYTVINICLGIAIGSGLWLIGMPNPALWGVMAACVNYVPYLGPMVGITIVGVVGLASFDVGMAIFAAGIYVLINGLEGNFITPMVMGRSMSLNPILIFLSVLVWGWIWGVGGALIAVPLLAIYRIVYRHFTEPRAASLLLYPASEVPEPAASASLAKS
ncbi:MAG: AI-2E family transporter [Pirellulales bacterium]